MATADVQAPGFTRTLLFMAAILVAATSLAILPVQGSEVGGGLLPIPGYTASLALAVLPLVPLVVWLRRGGEARRVERQAFRLTAWVVVPLWTLLDVLLAHTFFRFPNPKATLGLYLPGWHPACGWGLNIPLEELAFYLFACLTMVLLYAWSSERWFGAYCRPPDDYRRHGARCVRSIRPDGRKILQVAVLFALVCILKKVLPYPDGFPGYALVLIAGLLLPNYTLYPAISAFINKQAMLFTMTVVVLLSLVWEVTLGLPNQWWGYQKDAMLGIFVTPWSGLPVEAAFLWLMAGWGNVVLFEFFRLKLYSGRRGRELVLSSALPEASPPGAPDERR